MPTDTTHSAVVAPKFTSLAALVGGMVLVGWARVLVLMIVIWSALVAGSLAWYMHLQQQSVLNTATAAARANINKDQSFRKWAATHGGVYVPPTEHTPPNPYLKVPDRDVVTTTGKTLTLMNPAYMLRQLQSDFPGDYGTRSHITSLKPINPNNAPDAWEAKALHAFEQGGKELLEQQQIDGQPYLRMILPLVIEPGCLKCHAQQGYKLGDIRGGISTAVPLTHFLAFEREIKNNLILSHGAIWLLGLAGLVWLGISFRRIQSMEILAHSVAAIEKSERRFRAVAESANDAVINADSAGKVVDWNLSAERLFGYTKAEIIGQPLTVLMPERFRDLHSAGMARVVAGGAPHLIGKTVEFTGLHKDGSEFPLELSLAQWQAAEGQFFTAIIRDITERKRAGEALRMAEQQQRQLAKNLEIEQSRLVTAQRIAKIGSWETNLATMSVHWSDETHRIHETDPATFQPTHQSFLDLVHPEDRARVDEALARSLAGGTASAIEHRLLMPDKRIKFVEERWQVSFDTQGVPIRAIGTCQDITERKQADQVIAESESRFREIFNSISDAIFIHDAETGRIIDVNQRMLEMYGFTHEEALACGPDDLSAGTPPYSSAEAIEKIRMAHTEGTQIFDWLARARDGHLFWSEVNLRFVLIGNQRRILAIVHDITERKQAEAQLIEQLEELRRWHEITSGREKRILVLKHEINELLVQTGQPPRYPSAELSNAE